MQTEKRSGSSGSVGGMGMRGGGNDNNGVRASNKSGSCTSSNRSATHTSFASSRRSVGEESSQETSHSNRPQQHQNHHRQRPGHATTTQQHHLPPFPVAMPSYNVARLCGWSTSRCGYCHGERAYVLTEPHNQPRTDAAVGSSKDPKRSEKTIHAKSSSCSSASAAESVHRQKNHSNGEKRSSEAIGKGTAFSQPSSNGSTDQTSTSAATRSGDASETNVSLGDGKVPRTDGRKSVTTTNSSRSYGTWFEQLSCPDYQALIDRGWRRSGRHIYVPDNWNSCCPQIPIRLDVTEFKINKGQRKVLRTMANALAGTSEIESRNNGGKLPVMQHNSNGFDSTRGTCEERASVKNGRGDSKGKKVRKLSPGHDDAAPIPSRKGSINNAASTKLDVTNNKPTAKDSLCQSGVHEKGYNGVMHIDKSILRALQLRMKECVSKVLREEYPSAYNNEGGEADLESACAFKVQKNVYKKKEKRKQRKTFEWNQQKQQKQQLRCAASGSPTSMETDGGPSTDCTSTGHPPLVGICEEKKVNTDVSSATVICSSVACCRIGGQSRGKINAELLSSKVAQELLMNFHAENDGDCFFVNADNPEGGSDVPGVNAVGSDVTVASASSMDCDGCPVNSSLMAEAGRQCEGIQVSHIEALPSGHINVTLLVPKSATFVEGSRVEPAIAQREANSISDKRESKRNSAATVDYLAVALGLEEGRKHVLTVRSIPSEVSMSQPEVHRLYAKYQTVVHGDPDPFADHVEDDREVSLEQLIGEESASGDESRRKRIEKAKQSFVRFLVESPLPSAASFYGGEESSAGSFNVDEEGYDVWVPYGSYHQQYRIDGCLIAVGVVDVLPHCLSSVYSFYDPDLSGVKSDLPLKLNLGKYTALREIEWVKRARLYRPALKYYYLGYYIHSCPKMKYKAEYKPSSLLCPTKLEWIEFEKAKSLLSASSPHHCCTLSENRTGLGEVTNCIGEQRTPQAIRDIVANMFLDLGHRGGDASTTHPSITVDMLSAYGRRIVDPLMEDFVKTIGTSVSRRCVIKL